MPEDRFDVFSEDVFEVIPEEFTDDTERVGLLKHLRFIGVIQSDKTLVLINGEGKVLFFCDGIKYQGIEGYLYLMALFKCIAGFDIDDLEDGFPVNFCHGEEVWSAWRECELLCIDAKISDE